MILTDNLDHGTLSVALTAGEWPARWTGRYGVAWDPVRGRVGTLLVKHGGERNTIRHRKKGGAVLITLRHLPGEKEYLSLDPYVTLTLVAGVVCEVSIEER